MIFAAEGQIIDKARASFQEVFIPRLEGLSPDERAVAEILMAAADTLVVALA
jgi:hypothetical protein